MWHPLLPTTSIELRELCEILSIALVVPLNPDQYLKDKKLYREAQRKLKEFDNNKIEAI